MRFTKWRKSGLIGSEPPGSGRLLKEQLEDVQLSAVGLLPRSTRPLPGSWEARSGAEDALHPSPQPQLDRGQEAPSLG